MEKITLIYIGRRYTMSHKLAFFYADGSEQMSFAKAITPAAIGSMVKGERTATGVKGPYKIVGRADDSVITRWSIDDVAAAETLRGFKAAKEESSAHIDSLIQAVKDNTMGSDRRRVAFYIYAKLTGG